MNDSPPDCAKPTLDKLDYDPHTEGTDTSLSLILDLDFDSASAELSHHLRGKDMGWCDVEISSAGPGKMHFSLSHYTIGPFAELVLRRVNVRRSAIDYWPIFVPTLAEPPFSELERVERETRNRRAKEHVKAVLNYAFEQMLAETNAENPTIVANISGGINLASDKADIGGDVIGRDKIESAGGHIIHAEPGSTVIVGNDKLANTPPLVSNRQAEKSRQRQLTEARENLRLIEERKAQYVQEVDIPLQLIRDERHLIKRIAELEKELPSQ